MTKATAGVVEAGARMRGRRSSAGVAAEACCVANALALAWPAETRKRS
jgi:hypothetical protein